MESIPVNTLECKHCSKLFLTKSGLKRHMSGHLTVKPFKCQMCGTGFCHKSSFKRHVLKNSCTPVDMSKPQTHKLVGKLGRSQYCCPVCGVGFAHKYAFKTHMVMNACKVLETEQNSLSESSSIESVSLVESWAVDTGNIPKRRTKSVDSRINEEEFTEKVTFQDSQETCIVCRKVFPSKSDLEVHVKEHLKKKSYKSSSVAEIKTSLTENIDDDRAQNSQKVFPCHLCGKSTKSLLELSAHIEHCNVTGNKQCSICERIFTNPNLLRRHMRKHGVNVQVGRVGKGKKLPKSVKYIESGPSSPDSLIGADLHRGNQDVSLRKKKKLFGKTASVEEETPNDFEEMTVYITEEQMEDRDLFLEGDRLDKGDHIGHIAEDPLIDHSIDDVGDSSDNHFLENSQKSEDEKIVKSSSIQSMVCKVSVKLMEPVPDILSGTETSVNLCSVTNDGASHTMDDGSSDAYNDSYNKDLSSSSPRAQGNIDSSDLCSSLSLPAQSDNSGIVSTTITNETNLSDSSSGLQAQMESSVGEIMCPEDTSNELSAKRKEITTVYIEEDLDDEVEVFEELSRSPVERIGTSADPLTRDLLATEKHVFSEEEGKSDLTEHRIEHRYSHDVFQMTFNQKNTLHKQMAEHEEEQKFKCSVCWVDFWYENDLAEHMKTHEKSQQYTCNFCGMNFVKKCGLVGHLKTHLDVQSFSCDMCDRTFATKTPLMKHRRMHNARKKRKVGIMNAEQKNSRIINLVPNEREVTTNDDSFTVVFSLEIPESKGHDEQVAEKYKCNFCERTFHGRAALKKHHKFHETLSVCSNDNDIKDYSFDCSICHKQFRKKNHLARHYSVHRSIMHSCSICHFTVKSKEALAFHYKKHFPEEPLDLDMANKVNLQNFGDKNESKPHCSNLETSVDSSKEILLEKDIAVGQTLPLKTDDITGGNMENKTAILSLEQQGKLLVSKDQQEENIIFDDQKGGKILLDIQQENTSLLCDQKEMENIPVFGDQQRKNVEDQVSEQDGDKQQTEEELNKKKFVCHTCGRAFGKKSCLSMHSHIHRGNRPFGCPMCQLTFMSDKSLHVHLYQHKKLDATNTVQGALETKNSSPKKRISILSPPAINASVADSPTDFEVAGDGDQRRRPRECRLSGRRQQDIEEDLLACHYCNKRCLTKSALANHLKTHTEYEHFPCKLCGVTFYFEDTLLSHQKRYHSPGRIESSLMIDTLTADDEKHKAPGVLQFKESDISNRLDAADQDFELNCKSKTSSLTLGNPGSEIQGTDSNSAVTYQESLHCENMSDVSKDNLNTLLTCGKNLVGGQSGIFDRKKEAKGSKRKLSYVCSICGKPFLYHRMYMRHRLVCSKKKNAYMCKSSGCDRKFNRRYNLNRHMKVHFKSKLGLFGKKSIVKRNLYGSLNARSNLGIKGLLDDPESVVGEENCNLCGMNLKKSDLHNHLKECHNVISPPDTYEFREEADDVGKGHIALKEFRVKNHEDQMLSGPMEVEPMLKYGAAITNTKEPEQFNNEEQYNHKSITASYKEKIVGKSSVDGSKGNNFKYLGNDKNDKLLSKARGHFCKLCNINLFRYQSYTNHMKLHKDIKNFKCSICGEMLCDESELLTHSERHNSELLINDETKHIHDKKNVVESSPSSLLDKDSQSSTVSGCPSDVKTTSETIPEKEALKHVEPESKRIRLQDCEYDCTVCGRLILHAVDFILHLSFHKDRDQLMNSHYGPSDQLYDVIQLMFKTPICNACRKVFCICKALGLGEDEMNMYDCDVCEMKFMVKWSLANHMSQHGDIVNASLIIKDMKAHLMKSSGKLSSNETILLENKQSEEGRFQCSICGKTAENVYSYILHLKTHERIYSFKCRYCQKSFKRKIARDNHMKIHKKPGEACVSKVSSELKEKQNIENVISGKGSDDECNSEGRHKELSERKSSELDLMLDSRTVVDVGGVKSSAVTNCGRVNEESSHSEKEIAHIEVSDSIVDEGTKQENMLEKDKDIDGNNIKDNITSNNEDEANKGSYVCPVCNESFSRYQKLLSHEKVHFEPVMYDCEKCKNFFQCKEDYDEHLKTHNNRNFSKYYGCPVCGKKMANHANFLRHYASHSPMHDSQIIALNEENTNSLLNTTVDNDNSFSLPGKKCEKFKSDVQSSVTGVEIKLGRETENLPTDLLTGISNERLLETKHSNSSDERLVRCKFCNLLFSSLVDFQKHNVIHEFTCRYCGHTFSRKSKYKMHVKRHSAKDKHCKHCWRRFLRNREFELHKRTHMRKDNSSFGDSREGTNASSDEANPLKPVDKSELEVNKNRGKVIRKGYRSDSRYFEDGESGCEQNPINSHENVNNLKDPGVTPEVAHSGQQYSNKKLHKCKVCEKSFPSYRKYREHRKVHLKIQHITCNICKESFDIRSYLKHMDDHEFMPPYSCFQCGKKFSDHQLFAGHCKEHDMVNDNERQATSDANGTGSSANGNENLDSLELASNSVATSNSRHVSYTCDVCRKECDSCYFFNRHMEEHFKNKPIVCDICKLTLLNKERFKKHLKTHLLRNFTCKICDKSFTHRHVLTRHVQRVHSLKFESAKLIAEGVENKEKFDVTENRDKKVSAIDKVSNILDMVPELVETYKCRICSKSLSHKYKYVTHLRKSHKLDLEQAKRLAAEAQVKEIVDVTDTGEDESASASVQRDVIVYESEMELKMRDMSVNKKEKKKRTGDDLVPGISDPAVDKVPNSGKKCLVCPLCGKVCSCRSNLNDHVISHSNDKPWRCPDCKIKFKRLWDRNRHIRKKHGCDPKTLLAMFGGNVRGFDSTSTIYDCTLCDKRFLYDSVLKMHMMFHAGESSLDYVACEEEEVYECAVERNEDDGLAGLERETSSSEERVFVADYMDRDYITEDVPIEIKEEIIDIDDVEDIIVEEFDVFSDLVLEQERDALELLPLSSVTEIDSRNEDEIKALNDKGEKEKSRKNDYVNATNKSSESLSAEEISKVVDQCSKTLSAEETTNVVDESSSESLSVEEISSVADEAQEFISQKGGEITREVVENVCVTSPGVNSCENSLDMNTEVNVTKDKLESFNRDEILRGTKAIETEISDSDSLQADRDVELQGVITKDIPGELEFSELSREVKKLIETREKKKPTFVSTKNVYCSLCDLYFTTQRQLFGHIHVHSGCVFYQCDVCGETVKNSKQYKEHALSHILDYFDCNDESYYVIKREPGKATKFSCSICEKSFGSRHQLTGHLHVHSRENTRSCEACGETFKSNKLAMNHLYEHLTLLFKGPTVAQIRQVKEVKGINVKKLPSLSELDDSQHGFSISERESIEKQDNCGNTEVKNISDGPKSCHEEITERNSPQFCLKEKRIANEEATVTSNRSESCLEEFTATTNKPDFLKDTNVISMSLESLHRDLKTTSDMPQENHMEMISTSDPLAFCPDEVSLNYNKPRFSPSESEAKPCEPELTPPELIAKPCEPELTPPEPEVELCEPEFTPPEPEVKPCEPEFTPPEPEVKPCEPEFTPPEPEVKPCEPEFAPPESKVQPCESEFMQSEPEYLSSVELLESPLGKKENDSSTETNVRDPDFKPYSCMYCSKLFQRKDSMRIHMRLHTGDRILECDVCSKKFVKRSHLTKHMQVHSKSLSN